jgi:hypothetical protein
MRQQFFHDEIVVNLPGKFPSVFNRFQLLVAFDLQINLKKKKEKKKTNKMNLFHFFSFLTERNKATSHRLSPPLRPKTY